MTAMEWLNWSRGPALQVSLAIFIFGMLLRVLEIITLGRDKDLSPARGSASGGAWYTLWHRSLPKPGTWKHLLPGFIWHIAYLLIFLFLAPHILLIKHYLGLSWSAFSNFFVDILSIAAMAALSFLLFTRFTDPVRRLLSGIGDYVAWLVTFLPLVTGYMAMHRLTADYTLMLAIHISSVNLLLIVFPFSKLTHAISLFFSRCYNGATAGRKGIHI